MILRALALLTVLSRINGIEIQLPDINWNPFDPVFACDTPTIKVHLLNSVKFVCPLNGIKNSIGFQSSNAPIENMYYLGDDKLAFDTCNATQPNHLKVLTCKDPSKNTYYDLSFVQTASSSDQPEFRAGKSYYLIGTGYRTAQNISQNFGGSCSFSDDGGYKLRLKIYVCTTEEINAGNCKLCQSQACYYKDCGKKTCTGWQALGGASKTSVPDSCVITETRSCTDDLIGITTTEVQEKTISCPQNCTEWSRDNNQQIIIESSTSCYNLYKRTCTRDLINETIPETEKRSVVCPTTTTTTATTRTPVTLKQVGGDDDANSDDEKFYIAVGATVVFFFIGIMLGVFIHRHFQTKNSVKQSGDAMQVYNTKSTAFDNEGFNQYDDRS